MSKMDKKIMVVPREKLFSDDQFQGFKPHEEVDYVSRIVEHSTFMRRGDAEENPDFKQPICYIMIVNPTEKKVFSYQRASKDAQYTEKRLQGKWSWGIGGHVDQETDGQHSHPLFESLKREFSEEVDAKNHSQHKIIGYINSEADPVSQVHFGVLCVIETDHQVKHKDAEIAQTSWKTIEELKTLCQSTDCKVEEWSKSALEPIKQYFSQLK